MMAVLVGFVALAVDSARAFDGRRILQDSVDAAALAAAETFQNQGSTSWAAAETNAVQLFEHDNRLYAGASCVPGVFATPTIGAGAVTTTCTMSGGSGYVLTLSVADNGPAGQTFALSATRPLTVALMQVLGQAPTITLTASASATADDQAATPALAALSQAQCFGVGGPIPLNISTSTSPYLAVLGDVVSNGAASFGGGSFLHIGGDLLTRCAAATNADHVTYECWPSGSTPPCGAGNLQGCGPVTNPCSNPLRSTTNHFADPGYAAPPTAGLVSQGNPLTNVNLVPGIYSSDPQFGSGGAYCYFLAAGVYEWQGGLTISGGLVSNELRPPDGPSYNLPTTRSPDQFWDDWDHAAGHLHCDGAFALTAVNSGVNPFSGTQSYSVVVTSVRTDGGYTRESAPSACKTVTVNSGQVIRLVISNVPGAATYRVYAASNNSCTPPFGFVTMPGSNLNVGTPTNTTLGGCPDVSFPASGTCSLGQVNATYDTNASQNFGSNPPDPVAPAFAANLPTQSPARNGTVGRGDLANENHCGSGGVSVACPLPGSRAVPANLVTPGAVVMYMTNNSCLSVNTGDAYLFSGYQYNWILNYEPPLPATPCPNTWQGRYNSAPIGMSYTPNASFRITGNVASQSSSFGGVVAYSILVQNAGALSLDFNPLYAPRPPGTRLTS